MTLDHREFTNTELAVSNQIDLARVHANSNLGMCLMHLDKAEQELKDLKLKVYSANRRSGEVK